MKTIRLSGIIGLDILAGEIVDAIEAARGDSLDVQIASFGGSVFDGLEIFNALRGYEAKHPQAQIEITITGVAASMASYIASLPGATVRAFDNAVYMLHHPWNGAVGDHRAMTKNADFLRGLSSLMVDAYVRRSGKSRDEITEMMDEETWLYGDQLKAEGFADEIIPAGDGQDDTAEGAVARARLAFTEAQSKLKTAPEPAPERVAACLRTITENTTGGSGQMSPTEHRAAALAAIQLLTNNTTMDPAKRAEAVAALAATLQSGEDTDGDAVPIGEMPDDWRDRAQKHAESNGEVWEV